MDLKLLPTILGKKVIKGRKDYLLLLQGKGNTRKHHILERILQNIVFSGS